MHSSFRKHAMAGTLVLMVVVTLLLGMESVHACTFSTTQSSYTITQGTPTLTVGGTDDCFPPGTTVNVFLHTGPCGSGGPIVTSVSVVTNPTNNFSGALSTASLAQGTYCITVTSPCTGQCVPPVNVDDSLVIGAVAGVTSNSTSSATVQAANSTQPVSFQAAWGSYGNGTGQFSIPTAVAIDSSGNVYVADTGNDRVEKFTSSGTFISQWGTSGSGPGQFNRPWGIAIDQSGNVYVTDTGNSRVEKFTDSGTFISQWGTRGSGPGQFSFLSPVGIAVDSSGNVYVVDTFNLRVEKFTSSGTYLTQFGPSWSGPGQFTGPNSVAVDSADNVFVTDATRVVEFAPSGTFSTMFGGNGTGPGQFTSAYGIATDSSGNVYVVDGGGARVEEFTNSGTFLAQWPCATGTCPTGSGSGQFNVPYGIAITSLGLVYVTDMNNRQVDEFSLTSSLSAVTSPTNSTNQPPPTSPPPNPGLSGMGALSQSTLLLVVAIAVLAVLLVVATLKRRRPIPQAADRGAVTGMVYCEHCGAQNLGAQQFCEKCGAKLVK